MWTSPLLAYRVSGCTGRVCFLTGFRSKVFWPQSVFEEDGVFGRPRLGCARLLLRRIQLPEVFAERVALLLVRGPDRLAVEKLGPRRHPLERELAHPLAVVD